ncbi:MAG: hypothetical protein ACOYEO_03005 [bacterium]|jgi:hypothetical protein
MEQSRDLFNDPRLLQGAPLMPLEEQEGYQEEEEAIIRPVTPEGVQEDISTEAEEQEEMTTLAAQGKMVVRQAVVSGRAEEVLGTAVQFTEKTREGFEVLLKVLALTKSRLDKDPEAEGLSGLDSSQLELFWKFIQAPEFQNLTASLLAKALK